MPSSSQQLPYLLPRGKSARIGRYTLDIAGSALICEGKKTPLRPQVLRAIEAVTATGKIARKELATAIWGADAPDRLLGNALDQVISDVRAVLIPTPDLRLERDANGYWLRVLDLEQARDTKLPEPGDKFPFDYLLEPHSRLVNCELAELQCLIAGPEALELKPRFARATVEHMAADVRVQMLLPATQLGRMGKLLFQLIAGDLPDDGDQTGVRQGRLNRMLRNFRVSIIDEDGLLTGVHLRIYAAGMDRDAVAIVLPGGTNEGVVYSRGVEASRLHQALQAKMLPFGRDPIMIGLSGTTKPGALEELRAGIHEQFDRYQSIANQIMGCCTWLA